MRFRMRLLFALLVLAPLAALAWLGTRAARNDEQRMVAEIQDILQRKLQDHADTVETVLSDLERKLLAGTEHLPAGADALRGLGHRDPWLSRLLLVDRHGRLLHPPLGDATEAEVLLAGRTRELWQRGALSHPPPSEGGNAESPPGWGWHTVEHGEGLSLLFWRAAPDGSIVAVELPGIMVLGAIVARLPTTSSSTGAERVVLLDQHNQPAYVWGGWEPPPHPTPLAHVALASPLDNWHLAYLGPAPVSVPPRSGLIPGLVALGLAMAGTAFWIYRENTRELRLATQRVSFVNQVSHELKTPLTSIRMYSELLDEHLTPDDDEGRRRLQVVVHESERLTRLIQNILTFGRSQKGTLAVTPVPASIDGIVEDAIGAMTPALQSSGVTVRFEGNAPGVVRVDADALSQILHNLLSNVQKYAPRAEMVVRTAREGDRVTITVADGGPGIPVADRERAFEPFVRLGDERHEGVPGTGIGLAIARELARLHGGDLVLRASERGACFELTLHTGEVA